MTPSELIETYGLTDEHVNRALRHIHPETVAAYANALEAFSGDMSAENFNACLAVERRILQEATHRLILSPCRAGKRVLVALWRSYSEGAKLDAEAQRRVNADVANGMITFQPNDW